MLDIGTKIANIITIMVLISYAAYLHASAKDTARYHMVAFYGILLGMYKPALNMWKHDKINFFTYLAIPCLFGVSLILISQFYDGIYKIRYDFQILLGALLWLLLLTKEKFKDDLIDELKRRLGKYE